MRAALLAESYAALGDMCGGPAARSVAFPFEKKMNVPARAIYDRWAGRSEDTPFKQPWPDLAIRAPHRIVVEGKYFRAGSLEYAERQLVTGIHEANLHVIVIG